MQAIPSGRFSASPGEVIVAWSRGDGSGKERSELIGEFYRRRSVRRTC